MRNGFIQRARATAALALVALTATAAFSSGTYPARTPRPTSRIDATLYHAGKELFVGKVQPDESEAIPIAAQQERLVALQSRLPTRRRSKTDLTRLAGRMDTEHFAALEYYLSIRFKILLPDAAIDPPKKASP